MTWYSVILLAVLVTMVVFQLLAMRNARATARMRRATDEMLRKSTEMMEAAVRIGDARTGE